MNQQYKWFFVRPCGLYICSCFIPVVVL